MARGTREKNIRGAVWGPVSLLLIVFAAVLGLSVFFRVHDITVTGNVRYTEDEILLASGIEQGDNLFFIDRGEATARINAHLPYIERAWIERSLPNRLEIHVIESDAIAAVAGDDGRTWVLDRTAKLLSSAEAGDTAGLIAVDGLTAAEPEVGEILVPDSGETAKVEYLADLLMLVSELGMQEDISEVDISNYAALSFRYLDRFTVRLGPDENLEYKFRMLLSAVARMNAGDRGTLDLSIDDRVHLTYD